MFTRNNVSLYILPLITKNLRDYSQSGKALFVQFHLIDSGRYHNSSALSRVIIPADLL